MATDNQPSKSVIQNTILLVVWERRDRKLWWKL